ncbi:hypothetical protein MMPV_007890 [Pyropia vietnamensis]
MEVHTVGITTNLSWSLQATLAHKDQDVEILSYPKVIATTPMELEGAYTSGVLYHSIEETGPVSFRVSLIAGSSVDECKTAYVAVGLEPKPVACPVRNVSPGGKGGAGESAPPTSPATRLLAQGGGGADERIRINPIAPVAHIVGGRHLRTPDEQSLLARILNEQGSSLCTGSFFAPHHVVTAAHCPLTLQGTVQIFPPRKDSSAPAVINMTIATAALHPLYKATPSLLYDVAVVTLLPPAGQAKAVADAPWPRLRLNGDAAVPAAGDAVRTSGYGLVVDAGPASNAAQFVDQPVLTPKEAFAYQRDVQEPRLNPEDPNRRIPPEERLDHPAVMCTAVWDGDCSSCQGDSGGPVYHVVPPSDEADGRGPTYLQVGITSYGEGCGRPDTADVAARVSTFKNWIDWQMRASPGGTAGVAPVAPSPESPVSA